MKKLLTLFLLLFLASYVSATSGAIWTTNADCGNITQNVNHYAIGDKVFINGDNFNDLTQYNWDIVGQPGQASCDPDITVANGNYTTDANGSFCFEAYTVANDDCGEYKVGFSNKNDNYQVDVSIEDPSVPEFGLIAGAVALVGLVAGVVVLRKK
jgi:hypothetical protein